MLKALASLLFVVILNVSVVLVSYFIWFDVLQPIVVLSPPRVLEEPVYAGDRVRYARYISVSKDCKGRIENWLIGPRTYKLEDSDFSSIDHKTPEAIFEITVPAMVVPGTYLLKSVAIFPKSFSCNPLRQSTMALVDLPLVIESAKLPNTDEQ